MTPACGRWNFPSNHHAERVAAWIANARVGGMQGDALDPVLADQLAYDRAGAVACESLSLRGWGGAELAAAIESFALSGDILELACGPGMWTELLVRHATSKTAVDGAPEML